MSATDRLERLLYVLPRAAQPQGVRIDELCGVLGVDADTILGDITEATDRIFYQPGGHVDPFELALEDDVVRLYGDHFQRPARLTEAEAMALGLGLRVLAAESDVQRRASLLELAHRFEKELVTPDIELAPLSRRAEEAKVWADVAAYQPVTVAFEEDDFRGDIAEAIERGVFCDVVYLKAGVSEPSDRRVAPIRLAFEHGHWYMQAVPAQSNELRSYRLDRVMRLQVTNEPHGLTEMPPQRPTFAANSARDVQVRYSPAVARWVAEREDAQCEADGSLVLTHNVADMNWLVRHVLQYGGEAVVETADARQVVARAASQVLSPHVAHVTRATDSYRDAPVNLSD